MLAQLCTCVLFSTHLLKIQDLWHLLYMSSLQQQPCNRGHGRHKSRKPCHQRTCWGLFILRSIFTNTHAHLQQNNIVVYSVLQRNRSDCHLKRNFCSRSFVPPPWPTRQRNHFVKNAGARSCDSNTLLSGEILSPRNKTQIRRQLRASGIYWSLWFAYRMSQYSCRCETSSFLKKDL